jgi:putative hydrolase of the HAD superfamily
MAQHGVRGFGNRSWELFELGQRGDIFDRVLSEYGINSSRSAIEQLVAVYRCHEPAINLLKDAHKALEFFYGKVKLALITDGPLEMQERKICALNLGPMFDVVVMTGSWGPEYYKPHARSFLEVEEQLKVKKQHCAYIADNPAKDFLAPKSLGWRTVRVRRRGGLHAEVAASASNSAEIEISDLFPLIDTVAESKGNSL